MIKLFKIVIVLVCLSIPMNVLGEDRKPRKGEDGIYSIVYKAGNGLMIYYVDTTCQVCFALSRDGHSKIATGMTKIPCEDLIKRSEWEPIITWIEKKNQPNNPLHK